MDSNFVVEISFIVVEATLTMCEFYESTCNGFGDIWWTDNPIYFSSIDIRVGHYNTNANTTPSKVD